MKWFRMYNDILDDPKIAKMSAKTFKFFTLLLAFCSSLDQNGTISCTKNNPIWRLRMRKSDWNRAVNELVAFDILKVQGDDIIILNWDKRQYKSDDINERVKRYREKHETLHETLHETVTDTDTDSDTEKENKQKKKRKRFVPPSLDEINQFLKERSVTKIPPESFFNYYESIGWMVGKNKMKSWKAALSGWISRDDQAKKGQVKDEYTYEEIVAITNGTCSGYEIIPGKRTWRKTG